MARLTTIAVALCAALGMVAPSLAAAGTISGTVTAEGGAGIQGIEVCPNPIPYTFEADCTETDGGGNYGLSLPGGSYKLGFSAFRNNLNYVSELYNDKQLFSEADLITIGEADTFDADAALAPGGSIAGTVVDENTEQPIADIRACARDSEGFNDRCANTSAAGTFQINGLPSGTYSVEFEGGNRVNYLREFYEDAEDWAAATDVVVAAPGTVTSGIDAKLARGAEILGRVTEIGTGAPRRNAFVCANEVAPGEYQGCASSDAAGNYAIRSLPAGTYLVAFDLEYTPFGKIAGQWWQGAATIATATPITIAPPETRSGIDGQLPPLLPKPILDPIQVSLIPTPKHPPRKCKKGFHKKKVKGKKRCVRKHKRHGKGSRNGGKSKPGATR